MSDIGRRAFLATASGLAATSIACGRNTPPHVATASMTMEEEFTNHFLSKTKLGRFGLGVSTTHPALWLNVYGLGALIVSSDKKSAEIVFPDSGEHDLMLWYLDASSRPAKKEVKTKLTLSNVDKSSTLTIRTAANASHPYDSVDNLADMKRLGITAGTRNSSNAVILPVSAGQVFGGRPYFGLELLFQSDGFEDLDAIKNYSGKPSGQEYSLTDNFNWLVETSGVPEFLVDNETTAVQVGKDPSFGFLYPVCLSHNSTATPQNIRVLSHTRYFAPLTGNPVDAKMRLPVFTQGHMGETEHKATWQRNSEDPICNGFVIWD